MGGHLTFKITVQVDLKASKRFIISLEAAGHESYSKVRFGPDSSGWAATEL